LVLIDVDEESAGIGAIQGANRAAGLGHVSV